MSKTDTNHHPFATIIISSFNYARFLPQCIASALGQDYPHTEVIVVDDGSTDESRQIISRFDDRVVAVLKENGGQASAWNVGLARSRGDVVLFLDSDDVLLPTAVSRAIESFRDAPGAARVHWPMLLIDERGERTGQQIPAEPLPDGDFRDDVIRDGPIYDVVSPTTGNAWSRAFLERAFPIPESEFRVSPDLYLFALSPLYGPLRRIEEPQACYRGHGENHGWGRALAGEKLEQDLRRVECIHAAVERHLRRANVAVDPQAWKQRNWNYKWIHRLSLAKQDLTAMLPERSTFILVDGDEWNGQHVPGRRALPFPQQDGCYWGPPADDAAAIEELERLRAGGATFLVFWWTAFWWLDHYASFHAHVRSRYRQALNNERLIAFDLRQPLT